MIITSRKDSYTYDTLSQHFKYAYIVIINGSYHLEIVSVKETL